MLITIPKMTVFLCIAGLLALSLAGQAQAKNCGGLNQKSCWRKLPRQVDSSQVEFLAFSVV